MKIARQGNIRKEQETLAKGEKQGKNKVFDMAFDVSSLPKDVRIAIYKEMIERS